MKSLGFTSEIRTVWDPRGVLRISSDGDDKMGANIKLKKVPRASKKPQNYPGPKINPPKKSSVYLQRTAYTSLPLITPPSQ